MSHVQIQMPREFAKEILQAIKLARRAKQNSPGPVQLKEDLAQLNEEYLKAFQEELENQIQ